MAEDAIETATSSASRECCATALATPSRLPTLASAWHGEGSKRTLPTLPWLTRVPACRGESAYLRTIPSSRRLAYQGQGRQRSRARHRQADHGNVWCRTGPESTVSKGSASQMEIPTRFVWCMPFAVGRV